MLLSLLACLLLGCADAAEGQSPGEGEDRRVRREEVSTEDIVKAATAADFETRAGAAAAPLEKRLAALEARLVEQSTVLEGVQAALLKLDEAVSEKQHVAFAPYDTAVGPQPSDRPSPTAGRVLGEPCRLDSDCADLLTNTECSRRGRCVCAAGLLRGPGETCRPSPRLDDECRIHRHCDAGTPHAVCSRGVCRCPASMMTLNHKCRPYPKLLESCRADADCRKATKYAMCSPVSDRCVCPSRFWNRRNVECRPVVGMGRRCHYHRDCSTVQITTCIGGKCDVRRCDSHAGALDRIRLVGGRDCSTGYVEFTLNAGDSWQFVCDANWTTADATVACRHMGFDWGEPKLMTLGRSNNITRFLWTLDLECEGTEPSLTLCEWHTGRTSCMGSQVATVQCFLDPTEPPTTEPPTTDDSEGDPPAS